MPSSIGQTHLMVIGLPDHKPSPLASEECELWRRQRSQFAEKLAVHLITIEFHT